MKICSLYITLFLGIVLYSCQNVTDNDKIHKDVALVCTDTVKKNCSLSVFSYDYAGSRHFITFSYNEAGKVSKAEMSEEDSEQTRIMSYEYDKKGLLSLIVIDNSTIKYIYGENGKLLKLEGTGNIQTREFKYNEDNMIIKQNIIWGGKVFSSMQYEYDENDAPIKIKVIDSKGEEAETYEITYDDKINPFTNLGTFANISELLLGYPVGNYKHNVNGIIKTYVKKTQYQINGKYKKQGEKDMDKIIYNYNQSGYPISILKEQNNKKASSTLEYNYK